MLIAIISLLAALAPSSVILNNGPCLDSLASVPQRINGELPGAAVVKIDKVISTSTMIAGETIGYLYTRQDGTTWLGQRAQPYMSAANSEAINRVLAYSHMPNSTATQFPPVTRYGLKTNLPAILQIQPPTAPAMQVMSIQVQPCVAWPAGAPLPTVGP